MTMIDLMIITGLFQRRIEVKEAGEYRHRSSRDGQDRNASYPGSRNYDSRPPRDDHRGFGDSRRARLASPNERRRGYVDRDNEGYRSPEYRSKSRSRSRSASRRERSPQFGAPPSKEVILEGIPLDILEEDVRHHLPNHTMSASIVDCGPQA
ncbi:MAG: hypothetical protein Q9200_000033 [Gallowayella weberi]